MPDDERFDADTAPAITALPWDESEPDVQRRGMETEDATIPKKSDEPAAARSFKITKGQLEKFGYTEGCGGCRDVKVEASEVQAHNPRCRARIKMGIQGDPAEKDRLRDEGARMQHQEKRNVPNNGPGEGDQQQAKKRRDEEARGSEEDKRQAEEFEDLCRKQAEKESSGKAPLDQSRSEEDEEDEEEQATKEEEDRTPRTGIGCPYGTARDFRRRPRGGICASQYEQGAMEVRAENGHGAGLDYIQ